jgi:hypothetical protein
MLDAIKGIVGAVAPNLGAALRWPYRWCGYDHAVTGVGV